MIAGDRIEWRRAFPRRQLRLLGAYTAGAALVAAAAWMFFGAEPERLNTGAANPLAAVPQWISGAAAAVVLAAVVPVLRRPSVAASKVTLHVRPGAYRTLDLPWTDVAELAAVTTRGGGYLLVRLHPDPPAHLTVWDRAALRAATRDHPPAGGYDLAVRLTDFAGAPEAKMAALAAYAPEPVDITSRL